MPKIEKHGNSKRIGGGFSLSLVTAFRFSEGPFFHHYFSLDLTISSS
jgi:hypothetical protein